MFPRERCVICGRVDLALQTNYILCALPSIHLNSQIIYFLIGRCHILSEIKTLFFSQMKSNRTIEPSMFFIVQYEEWFPTWNGAHPGSGEKQEGADHPPHPVHPHKLPQLPFISSLHRSLSLFYEHFGHSRLPPPPRSWVLFRSTSKLGQTYSFWLCFKLQCCCSMPIVNVCSLHLHQSSFVNLLWKSWKSL